MSKHTPGPWGWYWRVIDGNADCGVFWEKRKGHHESICRAPRYDTRERWEANARLIAAAPCLLEALRWYVANDDTNVQQDGNEFYTAGLRRAEAAIAKATGEQP